MRYSNVAKGATSCRMMRCRGPAGCVAFLFILQNVNHGRGVSVDKDEDEKKKKEEKERIAKGIIM